MDVLKETVEAKDDSEDRSEQMKAEGIIELSLSEWALPIVLVKKKDNSHRLCVDYHELNGWLIPTDTYPMPRIDDLIN